MTSWWCPKRELTKIEQDTGRARSSWNVSASGAEARIFVTKIRSAAERLGIGLHVADDLHNDSIAVYVSFDDLERFTNAFAAGALRVVIDAAPDLAEIVEADEREEEREP